MSALVTGHLFLALYTVGYRLFRVMKPYRFGVYGPSLVGKTTLDQYLTVPGDIDPIPLEFRTSHPKDEHGSFLMPKPHRKRVQWKTDKQPIESRDLGGADQFRNMWVEDMFGRKVEIILFMVDQRVLLSQQWQNEAVVGLKYLVDNLTRSDVTKHISWKARRIARKPDYTPRLFCLVINKMDIWWDAQAQFLWANGLQRQHPIVAPFRDSLRRLRKAGIRADVEAISAQHGMNVEKLIIKMIDEL